MRRRKEKLYHLAERVDTELNRIKRILEKDKNVDASIPAYLNEAKVEIIRKLIK